MFEQLSVVSFPTRILFGCGAVRHLPEGLRETGVSRPLIVTILACARRRPLPRWRQR